METKIINNRIFFNEENKAYANLTFDNRNKSVHLELIKVEPQFRNRHIATNMMKKILSYIEKKGYKYVDLNPLPLDLTGLNLKQLIMFYEKFGFRPSKYKSIFCPYLMDRFY